LFYDDGGMLYVNATTADPDSVKYSRQIDVTKPVNSLIVKLNPKDGTTLWRNEARGAITHVSGKFVYTLDASAPDETEDAQEVFGLTPPKERGYVRIRRISPGNGGTKWQYEQKRAPLDVEFSGSSIQILFSTEAQVLRFLSF
jgi:outer membrane protein assembly factor BamB